MGVTDRQQGVETSSKALPMEEVPTHLFGATVVSILLCTPLGIVSLAYAEKVSQRLAVGDVAGARVASRKAGLWMWWGVWLGLLGYGALVWGCVLAWRLLQSPELLMEWLAYAVA